MAVIIILRIIFITGCFLLATIGIRKLFGEKNILYRVMKAIGLTAGLVLSIVISFIMNTVIYFCYQLWKNYNYLLVTAWLDLWAGFPQSVRAMYPVWDKYGLRHNLKHLDSIKRQIVFWDIKKQAKYADQYTVMSIKKKSLQNVDYFGTVREQYKNVPGALFNSFNPTSIGNIAYYALHSKNEQDRDFAKQLLKETKEHYNAFKQ